MSVLERTAAALEPCTLRNALSAVQSRRKLHTAFWHHGAAEIELSTVWHTLAPAAPSGDTLHNAAALDSTMPARPDAPPTASIFLFDFLYPQGFRPILSRPPLGPVVIGGAWDRKSAARAYSSSTSQSPKSDPSPPGRVFDEPELNLAAIERSISGAFPQPVHKTQVYAAQRQRRALGGIPPPALEADLHQEVFEPAPEFTPTSTPTPTDFESLERIWDNFQSLAPEEQEARRLEVVTALAHSKRLTDAVRITELFPEIPVDHRTPAAVAAAVRAHVSLQDYSEAVGIFKAWADQGNVPVGLGPLVAKALGRAAWGDLADIWGFYLSATGCAGPKQPAPQSDVGRGDVKAATADSLRVVEKAEGASEETSEVPSIPAALSELEPPALSQSDILDIDAVPDIVDKLTQLNEHLGRVEEDWEHSRSSLKAFLKFAMPRFLIRFKPRVASQVVEDSGDPLLYEQFIRLSVERGQKTLATRMYLLYRDLPDVKIRVPIMQLMLRYVFRPNLDAEKMELIRSDWYKRYSRLDIWGYQMYLSLYAAQGDSNSFERMQEEFVGHYREYGNLAVPYLLRLYRKQRRPDMIRQTIASMEREYQLRPETSHWNMLVSSYARNNNHTAAVEAFADLCQAVEPDRGSFDAVMSVLGRRGDLHFVLQLQHMAIMRGIEVSPDMTAAVVDAYCNNESFDQALHICKTTTKSCKDTHRQGLRQMWNTLLNHYAKKRDLVAVHRTLKYMASVDVPYDRVTYYNLLLALAYCRQSHHALHLIRAGEVEGFIKPGPMHYVTLMAAFLISGEPKMVLKIDRLMEAQGFPASSRRSLRKIMARLKLEELPLDRQERPDSEENFAGALKDLISQLKERRRDPTEFPNLADLDRKKTGALGSVPPDVFAAVLLFAVKQRKTQTVQRLLALYRDTSRSDMSDSKGSNNIKILEALMLHEFYQKRYRNVEMIWESVLQLACEIGRPIATSNNRARDGGERIVPGLRFAVCNGMKTMQMLLLRNKDVRGLKKLVARVRAEGFELTGNNWNHYVQGLARLGDVREAFVVCEKMLMPQWTGWFQQRLRTPHAQKKLPLALRRMGSATEHRRPTSYTFLELARHYRELHRTGPWSARAEHLLGELEMKCPRTVRAIISMVRSGNPEEGAIMDGMAEWDKTGAEAFETDHDPWPADPRVADGELADEGSFDQLLEQLVTKYVGSANDNQDL